MTVRQTAGTAAMITAMLATIGLPDADADSRKAKCPRGTVPTLSGTGERVRVVRSHGKPRCHKPARPTRSKVAKPSAAAQSQIASIADQFPRALDVKPDAFAKIDKAIGSRRRTKLVALALNSWRKTAGARAHAAADDGGLHVDQTFGSKGTSAKVKLDAAPTSGDKLGLEATATVDIDVTPEGLKDLAPGALGDAKSAKAKLEVSFNDAPAPCPTAAGKVKGKLEGKVRVSLTTVGAGGKATTQFASAEITATYALTVGENARWQTIDDVEVNTSFAYGGTGKGTETWRGRRFGSGFDEHGIFGTGSTPIEKQYTHVDLGKGGTFGPHGSVHFDTGPTAWDIQSISNLKGLLITTVATDYLMFAAMEYVREVVAARLQKHWYDDEACLKFEASPAATRLSKGATTLVTARSARAADGGPVRASLTATGVASLTPATGQLEPSGSKQFTLTAPSTSPVVATWQLVALSRAGKKTLSGTLGDKDTYTVTLTSAETADFATHSATATLGGSLVAVETASPGTWTASGPVQWSNIQFTPKICSFVNPVAGGTWSVSITEQPNDMIDVDYSFDAATLVTASVVCPPAGPIPGEPGPSMVGVAPTSFLMPSSGGTGAVGGGFVDGGDGFTHSGTLVVTAGGA